MADFLGRLLSRAAPPAALLAPRHLQAYETAASPAPGMAAASAVLQLPLSLALSLEPAGLEDAAGAGPQRHRRSGHAGVAALHGTALRLPAALDSAPPAEAAAAAGGSEAATGTSPSRRGRHDLAGMPAATGHSIGALHAAGAVAPAPPSERFELPHPAPNSADAHGGASGPRHRASGHTATAPGARAAVAAHAQDVPPVPAPLHRPASDSKRADAGGVLRERSTALLARALQPAPRRNPADDTHQSGLHQSGLHQPGGHQPDKQPSDAPTIQVTIGRIELRAVAPAANAAAPRRAVAAPPALSLTDYLARRQGSGARR